MPDHMEDTYHISPGGPLRAVACYTELLSFQVFSSWIPANLTAFPTCFLSTGTELVPKWFLKETLDHLGVVRKNSSGSTLLDAFENPRTSVPAKIHHSVPIDQLQLKREVVEFLRQESRNAINRRTRVYHTFTAGDRVSFNLTTVAEPLMAVVARQSTSGSLTKRLKIDNEAIFREALRNLDSMHVVAIYPPIDPDVLALMQKPRLSLSRVESLQIQQTVHTLLELKKRAGQFPRILEPKEIQSTSHLATPLSNPSSRNSNRRSVVLWETGDPSYFIALRDECDHRHMMEDFTVNPIVELLRQDPPETFEMSNSQTRPDLSTSPQIVEELHVGMPCLNGSFDPVYADIGYIDLPVGGMMPNSVGKGFSQPVLQVFSTSAFVHAPKPWDISTYPLDRISLYEIDSEDIEALYNKSYIMAHHLVASVADTTAQVQLQYLHADADIIRMKVPSGHGVSASSRGIADGSHSVSWEELTENFMTPTFRSSIAQGVRDLSYDLNWKLLERRDVNQLYDRVTRYLGNVANDLSEYKLPLERKQDHESRSPFVWLRSLYREPEILTQRLAKPSNRISTVIDHEIQLPGYRSVRSTLENVLSDDILNLAIQENPTHESINRVKNRTTPEEIRPSSEITAEIDTQRNSPYWTVTIRSEMSAMKNNKPLTCLTLTTVLSNRTLCWGLAAAKLELAASIIVEADLVISPRTAIVFQAVAALPSEGRNLASYLGRLSRSFERVVVVLELHPGIKTFDANSLLPQPWTRQNLAALEKLKHATNRAQACVKANSGRATELDTVFEFVHSEDSVSSGCIVRACARQDEWEYAKLLGGVTAARIYGDRSYLHDMNEEDERDAEYINASLANSYAALFLVMAWGVLKVSRATLAELLDTFSPFVMPPLLARLHASTGCSTPILDNLPQPVKPSSGKLVEIGERFDLENAFDNSILTDTPDKHISGRKQETSQRSKRRKHLDN